MIQIFALTTRGLEAISAAEMSLLPGMEIQQIAYRRVAAAYQGDLTPLLNLRTLDDLFLSLATWQGIVPQRSALSRLQGLSAQLEAPKITAALETIQQLRPLPQNPTLSLTANFVGKRNYATPEIKAALSAGLDENPLRLGPRSWQILEDDFRTDLNLRLFIEHETAFVGLRLGARPLYQRPYKQTHLAGSLKPPVAAAMLQIAEMSPGQRLLDPCCGAGTLLVEAALDLAAKTIHSAPSHPGIPSIILGGDLEERALRAAQANARAASIPVALSQWDARYLPLESGTIDRIVTNLPWGRQVHLDESLAAFYQDISQEIARLLAPQGRAVLLTSFPELLQPMGLHQVASLEISLFGQTPTILVYAQGTHSA